MKVTIGKRTAPVPELEGTKLAWIRGRLLELVHGHVMVEFPTSDNAGYKVAIEPEWNVDPLEPVTGEPVLVDVVGTVLGYVDTLAGSGFGSFGAHVSIGGTEFYVDPKLSELAPVGGPAPKPAPPPPPPPPPPPAKDNRRR
jgi:hypothetical protein